MNRKQRGSRHDAVSFLVCFSFLKTEGTFTPRLFSPDFGTFQNGENQNYRSESSWPMVHRSKTEFAGLKAKVLYLIITNVM